MESAASFLVDRLWQEGGRLALLCCHIFDDIFDNHGVVGHRRHICQLHFNFHLAGTADFMVVVFDFDAPVFHFHTDTASQVVTHILGRGDVVAAVSHLIAVVSGIVQPAVPVSLSGVNLVSALFLRYFVARGVKQIKFKFGTDHHLVRDACFFHVIHGPQSHILRVLVEGCIFPFADHAHVAAHGKCGHIRERIYIGGIRVGQKDHVALFNGRVPVIGTVEADSVDEDVVIEPLHRYGDVTPTSVDVGHFEVDHADRLLLTQFSDFCTFVHKHIPLFACSAACPWEMAQA